MKSKLSITLASAIWSLFLLASSQTADASAFNYTILGTTGGGSFIENSQAGDIHHFEYIDAGTSYTITGSFFDDSESGVGLSDTSTGQFTTVATFNFGPGLTFTSDTTTQLYWFQESNLLGTYMLDAGLTVANFSQDLIAQFDPYIPVSNINVGLTFGPIAPPFDSFSDGDLTLNNSANQTMKLVIPGHSVTSIGAVSAVPEPSSFALLAVGLAGLGFARHRKPKAT